MDTFTKNHVRVRALKDGGFELSLSPEAANFAGEPLRFLFQSEGTTVDRGSVFGRVDGGTQCFRLHAPFSLVIEAVGAEAVRCKRSSPESDTLLAPEAYLSHLESGIPR